MTSPIPFSTEHLDGCETELRTALPELYSDPAQREIVERVLIAQLRAILGKTVAEVTLPLAPRDIDALCVNVDGALAKHKDLLDIDNLLRPAMPKINEVRQRVRAELEENFKAACRAALAEHKVYDRTALFYRGPNWFKRTNFPPFGSGKVFARKILEKTYIRSISNRTLQEIADQLDLPEHSEIQIQVYREALAAHDIIDHETLLLVHDDQLMKMTFPPWGRFSAFFSEILGESCGSNINSSLRHCIADRVGFSQLTSEERTMRYREALAAHSIHDRNELHAIGLKGYAGMDFLRYGKCYSFFGIVLRKTVRVITHALLDELADALGW